MRNSWQLEHSAKDRAVKWSCARRRSRRAFECRRFGFGILGAPLFQPPLNLLQGAHMRTELLFGAAAAAGIQIRPTSGTQALAVYSAKRLHRKSQQDLLSQDIRNRQFRSRKERSSTVFFVQLNLIIFVKHQRVALAEEKIEGFADLDLSRFEASRARQLNRCLQGTMDPDFFAGPFRGCRPIQKANLADILRSEIDDTGLKR